MSRYVLQYPPPHPSPSRGEGVIASETPTYSLPPGGGGLGRGGERVLDTKSLAHWLAEQAEADRVEFVESPILLPGGAVQQNWALDVDFTGGQTPGRQALVLRTNFQTPLPASRPKAEEFAVLQAVFAAGVTAPEPMWLCEDPSVNGQPFLIMRRCTGNAAARPLVAAATDDGFGAALAERLAGELALVHSLQLDDVHLTSLGTPAASSALVQLNQWGDWLSALSLDSTILLQALDWLKRHAPPQRHTSLVHRDFRSGNFLVENGSLSAMLDWEFAGWGDFHEDIGWFCAACWRAGADDLEAGGLSRREDFYTAYQAASGRRIDADAVAFWEVMAHVRWAIIARQQGARAARGDAPRHELLEAAAKVPGLERDIATMIAAT